MAPSTTPNIELIGEPACCPGGLLRRFAAEVLEFCGRAGVELAIALVNDEEIARLNREYRGVEGPTDVLSFPIDDDMPGGGHYLGDIAVSLPTAERQAKERGHDLRAELLILIAHGIIHLCGHDHENDSGEMEEIERRVHDEIMPRFRD